MPPPLVTDVFPLTVEFKSVNVPELLMPAPSPVPIVMVTPPSVRLAPVFTEKTREALPPEISRLLAPVELVIVNVPAVAALPIPSSPPVKVIVQTPPRQFVSPAGMAKSIVSATSVPFALAIAPRKLQSLAAAVQAVKAALSTVVSTVRGGAVGEVCASKAPMSAPFPPVALA